MTDFEGRTAIVTGGNSGIGRGIALAFAREGANIVVGSREREPRADNETTPTDKLAREQGVQAAFAKTDVRDPVSTEALVEVAIEHFDSLDIVVNNAGVFSAGDIEGLNPEDWQQAFDVNVTGIFNVIRRAGPHLRASTQGRIINVASQLGLVGRSGAAAYCASKGAVINLTRAMAADYAEDKVTVNAICPGIVPTAMTRQKLADPVSREMLERKTLLPYFGRPEDIGAAAVFLASDGGRYVTGHCLTVDGGYTAH